MRRLAVCAALTLGLFTASCKPVPVEVQSASARQHVIDQLADDYVKLSLRIGAQEAGYIDAYYGPKEWQPDPKAKPEARAALLAETRKLLSVMERAGRNTAENNGKRRANFLVGQLRAAETRLLMAQGVKFSFADEAERLFGVRPKLQPLASFDDDLAALEKLVAGKGSLSGRVKAAQDKITIPADRLKPVFDRAIAECKKRTQQHISLPTGENFKMEFVTGKSWSGYNYYQGGYQSLIQINTDLPIRLTRAIDLGCHEGYPGHHALNMLLEERLSNAKGWREFTVYPLYSPQSLIAEGSANYGIELAFPDGEKAAFERDVLAPIAGIDPVEAERGARLTSLLASLSGARLTIAQNYLDGEISRDRAIELAQKYQLLTKARATQSIAFTDQYRSYVINYGLGLKMVRDFAERGNASAAEKWRRMEKILSEPTLPGDLRR